MLTLSFYYHRVFSIKMSQILIGMQEDFVRAIKRILSQYINISPPFNSPGPNKLTKFMGATIHLLVRYWTYTVPVPLIVIPPEGTHGTSGTD